MFGVPGSASMAILVRLLKTAEEAGTKTDVKWRTCVRRKSDITERRSGHGRQRLRRLQDAHGVVDAAAT